MVERYVQKRVLITVRTYPTPAMKGVEVSCTAGITDAGDWIRLFPVPYRRLPRHRQFRKYDWVDLMATRARGDIRPESFTPDIDSIRVGQHVGTAKNWSTRKQLLQPVTAHCLCCLQREREVKGYPTLGLFRPATIDRLLIEPDAPEWSPEQLARLQQGDMFNAEVPRLLEKIPYKFSYRFVCDHDTCPGHTLSTTDWELGQAYRIWRPKYGRDWEVAFRKKFEYEMKVENETHFYVGTLHGHPATWIIVGLFYPRRVSTEKHS